MAKLNWLNIQSKRRHTQEVLAANSTQEKQQSLPTRPCKERTEFSFFYEQRGKTAEKTQYSNLFTEVIISPGELLSGSRAPLAHLNKKMSVYEISDNQSLLKACMCFEKYSLSTDQSGSHIRKHAPTNNIVTVRGLYAHAVQGSKSLEFATLPSPFARIRSSLLLCLS